MPKDYSDLGDKSKYINFKKLDISMESNLEWYHGYGEQLTTAKLFADRTLAKK